MSRMRLQNLVLLGLMLLLLFLAFKPPGAVIGALCSALAVIVGAYATHHSANPDQRSNEQY